MSAATCFLKHKVKASVARLIASDLEPAVTRSTQCTDTGSCAFPGCLRKNLVSKYRSFIHHVVLYIDLWCHILCISFQRNRFSCPKRSFWVPKPSQSFRPVGFPISKLFWKSGHAILVALGNVGGVPDSCNLDFRLSVYRDFLPLNRKKTSRTPEEFALRQSSLRRLLA